MSCPEYYKLADGRELSDFLKNEIAGFLEGKVSPYTCHCIMSAMEHYYRRGKKKGERETDEAATDWWISEAIKSHNGEYPIGQVITVCRSMIRIERHRYSIEKLRKFEHEVRCQVRPFEK